MGAALILLAVLSQASTPAAEVLEPRDHSFRSATESFVSHAVRPTQLETVLPAREARLVGMLGCDRHGCRAFALEELADPAHYRAWLWAARHRDPQIRSLGEALIDTHVCRTCDGKGRTPSPDWPDLWLYCEACGGRGGFNAPPLAY